MHANPDVKARSKKYQRNYLGYRIRCNFDWVKLPVFDEAGEPVHRRGVTQFPGIYFLGLRWLYKRKSAFLLRASGAEDAAYVAEQIMTRS